MQFEALKVFCDVARFRSFSQAALANELTQSAVSQIVSQIEKRLAVRLIDRSTRPLQLTPQGQRYYDGCKGLVETYLEIESTVRRVRTELTNTVRVAAIYSVGLRDMHQYVERFTRLQPDAEVNIEYLHPDRVYEKVLDGTADLGLISFPKKHRELVALPWRDEEMVLVCAPGHPLARHRSIRLASAEGQEYVAFDRGLNIRRRIDRFLRDHAVRVNVVHEFDNIENIKRAVESGAGVSFLPLATVAREVRAGTLGALHLSDVRFVRPLVIVHRRSPRPGTTVQRFIELLRQPDDARTPDDGLARRTASEAVRLGAGGLR